MHRSPRIITSFASTEQMVLLNKAMGAAYYWSRDPNEETETVSSPYPGTVKGDLLFNFIDSILKKNLPLVSAQEVLDATSVALAIDESTFVPNPTNQLITLSYFIEMKIPFGKPILEEEEKQAVQDVLSGPILVHGPKSELFEDAFREFTGASHAISVSSCTAGMHLIYHALGFGPR